VKVLVLGGTVFVGRHIVNAALLAGHEVSVFNRGLHDADSPPEVEKLQGDRIGRLDALRGRRWDIAIDTSGYVPSRVRMSAMLLSDQVEHYTFISTASVYRDTSMPGVDENHAVSAMTEAQLREAERIEPQGEIVANAYGHMYGPLKALCEREVEQCMPGRALNVRPGLIVGPFDYSDRFTYWPVRVAKGGEVLAPGRPHRQVQLIDVRDLVEWILRMAEARRVGTYNAAGPDYLLTMEALLNECRSVIGSEARLVWIADRFALDAGLAPWTEAPLWIPEEAALHRFFLSLNCRKALAEGLLFRPLAETIRDTFEWHSARANLSSLRAGVDAIREKEIIQPWKAQNG